MASRVTSRRLGDRADAQIKGLRERLSLPHDELREADVLRIALDYLSKHVDDFAEELRAYREAEKRLREWSEEYGARARLHLRAGEPLVVRAGRIVRAIPGTLVTKRKLDAGDFALGVEIVMEDGESLVIDAVRVATVPEAVVPLAAIHLSSPVPPARDEIIVRRGPQGTERIVWCENGIRRTHVGDRVLPARIASFA